MHETDTHDFTPFERNADFMRLPLDGRILDRLVDVMILTHDVLGELDCEEANAILWLEPHLRRVYDEVDSLVGRLAQ